MSRALSRNLCLIGIGVAILAGILLVVSFIGSITTTDPKTGEITVTSIGNPVLFGIAFLLFVISSIIGTIGWIGALIKMVQLKRWAWFIVLLIIHPAFLVYIFAGPTTPAPTVTQPQYAPPPQYMPPQGEYQQQSEYQQPYASYPPPQEYPPSDPYQQPPSSHQPPPPSYPQG